jgi:O-antigen ligase
MTRRLEIFARWLTVLLPVLLLGGHAAADAGLSLLAALFLIQSAAAKDWSWTRQGWVRALLLLWLYMNLRSPFTPYPGDAFHHSLPFIRYILFAVALSHWTLAHLPTRKRFLRVLGTIVLGLAADGLFQRLVRHDLLWQPIFIQPDGNLRLTGPFHLRPILGILLAWLSFPVALSALMERPGFIASGKRLALGLAGALLILAAIALSGERMALILTLAGWGLAVLLLPVNRNMILGGGLLLVLLIGLIAFISPMTFDRQIVSTLYTLSHWQESPYGILFASDVRLLDQHPVLGIGPNQFRTACPLLYPGATEYQMGLACNVHPHNIYLEWLIETGIIGFTLFLAFIALALRRCAPAWPRLRYHPVFAGALIAVALRLWPLAPATSFFSPWGAPPFWLMLGLMLAYTTKGAPDADTAFAL